MENRQRSYDKSACRAGRLAYKKARLLGLPVKKAAGAYTSAFFKIWKWSPKGRAAYVKYNKSDKKKAAGRRFRYGLSDTKFQEILQKQKNRCAICRKRFRKTPFVDHKKGERGCRGLLCSNCNFLIGQAKEEIKILLSAIKYLRSH